MQQSKDLWSEFVKVFFNLKSIKLFIKLEEKEWFISNISNIDM